ncbi:pyridoxal-phosphate dependent enzyme [Kibdelosporangium philippinense]|uniref:Pyridoxal-phosphate dependent enzyme n=1 Tax=Kibdelosporangium philippinense TaxID=211113 RepID=A0ABS8ZBP1_9PSEU|nr:pyridoxal-phosphate dependent enzyme [Kibdelosporangium philippinense]MCE7004584.1 pyridoxal-phosphate dependent enzyme [Kibdelosporangium philippinense]
MHEFTLREGRGDGGRRLERWVRPGQARATTASEILGDLDGDVAAIVCTTSSCGQITGIGRRIKQTRPDCRMVAVDGRGSTAIGGPLGQHLLVGLGSGFTPGNFDPAVIDEAYWCGDTEAFSACRMLASNEGLLLGANSNHGATIPPAQPPSDKFARSRIHSRTAPAWP